MVEDEAEVPQVQYKRKQEMGQRLRFELDEQNRGGKSTPDRQKNQKPQGVTEVTLGIIPTSEDYTINRKPPLPKGAQTPPQASTPQLFEEKNVKLMEKVRMQAKKICEKDEEIVRLEEELRRCKHLLEDERVRNAKLDDRNRQLQDVIESKRYTPTRLSEKKEEREGDEPGRKDIETLKMKLAEVYRMNGELVKYKILTDERVLRRTETSSKIEQENMMLLQKVKELREEIDEVKEGVSRARSFETVEVLTQLIQHILEGFMILAYEGIIKNKHLKHEKKEEFSQVVDGLVCEIEDIEKFSLQYACTPQTPQTPHDASSNRSPSFDKLKELLSILKEFLV